ncbi:MAG: hypothetical protein LBS74_09790 [Oscillospiraceae bacterium]|jgi:hypothetical protein|nr:hypothetical protein [Oscillospiraceae bacterium]
MNKYFKRPIALLLLAVIFLSSTGLTSFAVNSGDTVYISTGLRAQQYSDTGNKNAYATGVYWHEGSVSVRFITTRVGSSQTRTNEYVYCIEPAVAFSNNTYPVTSFTAEKSTSIM